MNIERRVLLKGMALGGLAGVAMSSSGLTMANQCIGQSGPSGSADPGPGQRRSRRVGLPSGH